MDIISIVRCFVLGMFYCLDLGLCISLRISYNRLKHSGQVAPSLCMASIAFGIESFSVLYGFCHRYFLNEMAFLNNLYVFSDFAIISLFMLSFLALITSSYPHRKSVWIIGLTSLTVFGTYLFTSSAQVFLTLTVVWLIANSLSMLYRARTFNKSLAFYYSNVEKHKVFWVVIALVVLLWLYPFYWYICFYNNSDLLFIVYAIMQMSVHVFFAYNMSSQIAHSLEHKNICRAASDSLETICANDEALDEHRQTADAFFTKVQQRKMAEHLNKLMITDKLYRNPDLSVDDIVGRLKTNSYYFYYFMRDVMLSSFLDYVNGFRVSEAKELLAKGEKVDFIVSVVGYNSANSFRRAFKRTTGMSPTEWRQQVDNGRQNAPE